MKVMAGVSSYWTGLAQCYQLLGPPLRPSPEDISIMEAAVLQAVSPELQGLTALLLGVTPDIVSMRWPTGCKLLALDSSLPMIQALWPVHTPDRSLPVCADWLAMPLRNGSCDLIIGDGSLISMSADGFGAMAAVLHSLLKPSAILILRLYLQPPSREDPDQVFEDMARGAIPSFHHFKLRLLMSMQRSVHHAVAVSDVYACWRRYRSHRTMLPGGPGWENPVVDMIEHYRDADTVYCFPTLPEFRAAFADRFEEASLTIPPGYLGERCPIVVLKPR